VQRLLLGIEPRRWVFGHNPTSARLARTSKSKRRGSAGPAQGSTGDQGRTPLSCVPTTIFSPDVALIIPCYRPCYAPDQGLSFPCSDCCGSRRHLALVSCYSCELRPVGAAARTSNCGFRLLFSLLAGMLCAALGRNWPVFRRARSTRNPAELLNLVRTSLEYL